VFFKEIKQTLQLYDFLGNSANAVHWQIWTALLVHLLLRFLAWSSGWTHAFTRLLTFTRAALWLREHLGELLRNCGTARKKLRFVSQVGQTWLPGFRMG
jgi:hypothetical protein